MDYILGVLLVVTAIALSTLLLYCAYGTVKKIMLSKF